MDKDGKKKYDPLIDSVEPVWIDNFLNIRSAVEDATLDTFVERLDFYFATIGMGVFKRDKYVEIHIQLTPQDYEKYFIIPTPERRLDCSKIVQWNNGEDEFSLVNIETRQVACAEDILVKY